MNKVNFKKLLIYILLISIISIISFTIINILEYNAYTKNYNYKLSSIISLIEDKYPNIKEEEIMEIVNTNNNTDDLLSKYNIDIDKDSVILENNKVLKNNIIFNNIFLLIIILIITLLYIIYNKKQDKEIKEIITLLENINKKNYQLNIDSIGEDELSILKSEIYKTTIMLKERALQSKSDKLKLKDSLSDISHQIKTPLTSISIILDNLIQDENMDKNVRTEFLLDIKREINNINFLVISILKLSEIDTNTVKFNNKKVYLKDIVNESIKRLSCVADLKNITIFFENLDNSYIIADKVWQVEAISNIIKNSIEHSKQNDKIDISVKNKATYKEIIIKDYGVGIDETEIKHIFEKFYKGKNYSNDSFGIGLYLAKSIIEKCNGKIIVKSKVNIGTTFIIRYY